MTGGPSTLLVFPHAGGSARHYIPFAKAFDEDVKCVAVQYPGGANGHDLGSFTGIPELADRIFQTLASSENRAGDIAFFGYSMGALLAFEVARRYERTGEPITALFVAACAAPGCSGYDHIPKSDRGLLSAVRQMTGANPEFLDDTEFAATILPTLHGFRAIVDYRCPDRATVSCPIAAFHGDDDEVATAEKVMPWRERTTAEFTIREFAGHHFFLNDHRPEIVADVQRMLTKRA